MKNNSNKVELSFESAEAEVNRWLEHKRISPKKRELQVASIDALIAGFQEGALILNEDFTITHKLKFPYSEDASGAELKYKPRLNVQTTFAHLQDVKSGDADGRLCAYVAALSSQTKGVIKKLDTEDYSLAQSVAVFFL